MNHVGPDFDYSLAPSLFGGRSGIGPLEIVWDTSVLVDYLQHGHEIWEERPFAVEDEEYFAELQGLGILINLWMRRNLRFHVLERSVTDAKKQLDARHEAARARAVDQVALALQLDGWTDRQTAQPAWEISVRSQRAALRRVPVGADRELVKEAVARGAHVFLTRDKRLLGARSAVLTCGLLLASPLDLLEEITACGALDAILEPWTMWWPLPDLQRTSHLIAALPRSD